MTFDAMKDANEAGIMTHCEFLKLCAVRHLLQTHVETRLETVAERPFQQHVELSVMVVVGDQGFKFSGQDGAFASGARIVADTWMRATVGR